MSTFNPEEFMNETIEGALDTSVIPVPIGEYNAQIEKLDVREVESTRSPGEMNYPLDVHYNILDDGVAAITGRDKNVVRGTAIWLDIDPNTAKLDTSKGKNVGLGKLRAACNMNSEGPFNPQQLLGQIVRVTVGHRADKNDPSIKYAEVKKVGVAS